MPQKKGFGVFITAFCISFVVLSALFLFFLLYTKTMPAETVEPNIPAEHIYTTDENMTALLFGCQKATDLPGLVVLVSYHAPQAELQFAVLPPETVCRQNGRESTLEACYDYEGVRGALNAAGELLNLDIQRYLRTDKEGLASLIDFLGGIEYDIPNDFQANGEAFRAGYQQLDGRRLNALLFTGDAYGAADTNRQTELLSLLFQSRINANFAENYDRFTATVFSGCETNLSQFDFLRRREGMIDHLRKERLQISVLSLEGTYSANHTKFTPDTDSLSALRDAVNGRRE